MDFARSSVHVDGNVMATDGRGFHAGKKDLVLSKLVLRSSAQAHSSQFPKLWIDLVDSVWRRKPLPHGRGSETRCAGTEPQPQGAVPSYENRLQSISRPRNRGGDLRRLEPLKVDVSIQNPELPQEGGFVLAAGFHRKCAQLKKQGRSSAGTSLAARAKNARRSAGAAA